MSPSGTTRPSGFAREESVPHYEDDMQITMTKEEEKAYLQSTRRSNPQLVQINVSHSPTKNAQQLLEGMGDDQPREVNSKSTIPPERSIMDKLPVEIQVSIAQQVTSRNDLASLRLVSKYWNDVASPVLFKSLIIETNDQRIYDLDSKPYHILGQTNSECLQMVREFKIHAVFHETLEWRCLHSQVNYDGVKDTSDQLTPLLKQLKPGALRSFCWDLRSCVSEDILGVDGHLQREQQNIESLYLNTATPTNIWDNGDYIIPSPAPLVLDTFRCLRTFSWIGLRLASELQSLRIFLAANHKILESLELDLIDWSQVNPGCKTGLAPEDTRVFTSHILPLSPDPSINSFPTLTTLSLSAVCLPICSDETLPAFDFSQLRALKLHRCKDTHLLLRAIVQTAQPLKLECLDLLMDDFADKNDWGGSSLTAFLRSFNSLRQLYLLITFSEMVTTEQYFESMMCHAATMKKLLYHERGVKDWGYDHGIGDKTLTFEPPDSGGSFTGAMQRFMHQSDLVSLGCCDSLPQLRRTLELHASKQSLQLLHARCSEDEFPCMLRDTINRWTVTGAMEETLPRVIESGWGQGNLMEPIKTHELFEFARWAFGSNGLPRLQILAFGDFSYDVRHLREHVVLCRQRIGSRHGFRLASRENVISLGGIDKPFDFLGACPKDPLYPKMDYDQY